MFQTRRSFLRSCLLALSIGWCAQIIRPLVGAHILWLAAAGTAFGNVTLPGFISDNMVIQQQVKAPISGWAEPGEAVSVEFRGVAQTCTADAQGCWRVALPPQPAGGPFDLTIAGADRRVIRNVLVGEVWVASGQSNMVMTVGAAANADQEAAKADFPRIREFNARQGLSFQPLRDVKGQWVVCSPATVRGFSAAAFYFAREIHQSLDVPVGILKVACGSTPVEAWIDGASLRKHADASDCFKRWEAFLTRLNAGGDYPDLESRLPEYIAQAAAARGKLTAEARRTAAANHTDVVAPPVPPILVAYKHLPSGKFNAMVHPLIPYAMRGVIWYQAESNSYQPHAYAALFSMLIESWRKLWNQGDFPFLYVQLPNYNPHKSWPLLREAQLKALALPNTGMAVTIDIGEARKIHPSNKQGVGHRLALIALAKVYGKPVDYSGPLYKSAAVEGDRVRIRFDFAQGLASADGAALRGFVIAGADRKFLPAEAVIEDESVVAFNKAISHPQSVRYAWAPNPRVDATTNLTNKSKLPASPFRTDSWEEQVAESDP